MLRDRRIDQRQRTLVSVTGSINVAAATGIVGGAQDFNGTDTEINVPADNSFDWQSDESFSIELWMQYGGAVTPPVGTQVMIGRTDAPMLVGRNQWR